MHKCKVIAIANQKGGVGKTTTAASLGVGLVRQGKKVMLIDADPQSSLSLSLGIEKPDNLETTIANVMERIVEDKEIEPGFAVVQTKEGIDLMPANIELSGIEVRLVNEMSRERVLKRYVDSKRQDYDFIIIDCMPSLGMMTFNALCSADSVIIPTTPEFLSAKGLEQLLGTINRVRKVIVSKTPGFQKENKKIPIYHCISILLVSSLLIAFGWSMELLKGIIFLQILLYASVSDIQTHEVKDFVSVYIFITGFIGITFSDVPGMLLMSGFRHLLPLLRES